MIGRKQFSVLSFQFSAESENVALDISAASDLSLKIQNSKLKTGFTLLELMIVISIIIILAVVIMPQYQKTITHTKETVLREDLFQLRKMIDQYAADKGKLPQSLDDLVSAGYIREIPKDPMTDAADWQVVTGEDASSAEGGQGITDVHSASSDQSSEGSEYNTW